MTAGEVIAEKLSESQVPGLGFFQKQPISSGTAEETERNLVSSSFIQFLPLLARRNWIKLKKTRMGML